MRMGRKGENRLMAFNVKVEKPLFGCTFNIVNKSQTLRKAYVEAFDLCKRLAL